MRRERSMISEIKSLSVCVLNKGVVVVCRWILQRSRLASSLPRSQVAAMMTERRRRARARSEGERELEYYKPMGGWGLRRQL